MSKRCELKKEYYQQYGNYKGSGKYCDKYVSWLEEKNLSFYGVCKECAVIGSAFLVKMRLDYAPYDVVVFANTEKGAISKSKKKFPDYEILSANFIRHYA